MENSVAILCVNCGGELRVKPSNDWPNPARYPTVGKWLCGLRHQCGGTKRKHAQRTGVSVATVDNWERGRTKPGVFQLRRMRDALDMPSRLVEETLRRFYVGKPAKLADPEACVAVFWRLIHSRCGSALERRGRDRIVSRYCDLARRAASRFRGLGELDDLIQVALLGLSGAVLRYVPTMASFGRFGSVTCHYSILNYVSSRYYESVPMQLRTAFTAVRRVVNRISDSTGRVPGEAALRTELSLPTHVIRQALEFLARRNVPFDGQPGDGGRSLHEVIGEVPSAFADTELRADIDRCLAHMPKAASLVTEHVLNGFSLSVVAGRVNLALDEARRVLAEAMRALRPLMIARGYSGGAR